MGGMRGLVYEFHQRISTYGDHGCVGRLLTLLSGHMVMRDVLVTHIYRLLAFFVTKAGCILVIHCLLNSYPSYADVLVGC